MFEVDDADSMMAAPDVQIRQFRSVRFQESDRKLVAIVHRERLELGQFPKPEVERIILDLQGEIFKLRQGKLRKLPVIRDKWDVQCELA